MYFSFKIRFRWLAGVKRRPPAPVPLCGKVGGKSEEGNRKQMRILKATTKGGWVDLS